MTVPSFLKIIAKKGIYPIVQQAAAQLGASLVSGESLDKPYIFQTLTIFTEGLCLANHGVKI